MTRCLFRLLVVSLAVTNQLPAQTNLLVAEDGSGLFKSVQAAIRTVPAGNAANPVVIRVRPGAFKESVYGQREKRFFRLIGEAAEQTVLTYDLHVNLKGPDALPLGTFRTPSTVIDAADFLSARVTFENSGRPVGQALAIRLDGHRAATVWRHKEMSDAVRPAGWENWNLPHREQIAHCAEFGSTGLGAQAGQRVKWASRSPRRRVVN